MIDLSGRPAEIRFTLEITRAATGLTETVDMVGHVVHEEVATTGAEHSSIPPISEGDPQ